MKSIRFLINRLLFIPMALLLTLNSCKHDDLKIDKENENFRPAAIFIKNNYDLSLFSAAIEKVGMTEQLKSVGPFTVLAPNNAAFNEMGIMRPSDLDKMGLDSLTALVKLHILDRRLLLRDIPANGIDVRYPTLAGVELYTSLASFYPGQEKYPMNDLYFNGANATRKDVTLSNGVLHVLNKVMKYNPKITVQDWLAKRPQYSILVTGLKKFGLWDRLATAGPYTVFAPSNKYFEAQDMTEASIASMKPDEFVGARLFGCYVLSRRHFFISDMQVFALINRQNLDRQVENDTHYLALNVLNDLGKLTYGLRIRTAKDYPYDNLTPATGMFPALSDNLMDNGLVHDLQGVLVLPSQAIKQK